MITKEQVLANIDEVKKYIAEAEQEKKEEGKTIVQPTMTTYVVYPYVVYPYVVYPYVVYPYVVQNYIEHYSTVVEEQ